MKKTLLILLAVVLVVAISVTGTLAYFTATTEKVENTFTVGNLFDPDDPDPTPEDGKFVLYEHKATADTTGTYTLGTDEVTSNSYTVLPGVDLPKDPFVRSDVKLALDAYVFVEVVDGTSDALTVTVDDAKWTQLTGVTGPNGGVVYYLKSGPAPAGSKLAQTTILKDNKIVVANTEITDASTKVDFYGYMIQAAGFTDAADAWTKGFASSGT